MRIARLHVSCFRNLKESVLDPHERFNVFEGRNAQGKTNLLEAVYLLASLKSFRPARNRELIRRDEMTGTLEGVVERRGVERTLAVQIERSGRAATIDGKRIQRLSEYFGHFNVVLFTPEDLAITKGEPGGRRRFLDRAVFNADASHMDLLRDYGLALRNRNALLREGAGRRHPEMLLAFDEPLCQLAARVVRRRRRYLTGLAGNFRRLFATIDGEERDVVVRYRCTLQDEGEGAGPDEENEIRELAARMRERLQETLATDIARSYTSVGPHMDELVATIDGQPLRRFGSQGQHRTFVLALKVAEVAYLHELLGFHPILLLDDVSSELDAGRRERLLDLVGREAGQVFFTTTDRRYLPIAERVSVWRIEDGEVSLLSDPGEGA